MSRPLKSFVFCALATALIATSIGLAGAKSGLYKLSDHPDGNAVAPTYGLRLDNLLQDGTYTFSFDYADQDGVAEVTLFYDDVAGTVQISGRAYGGLDVGDDWDSVEQGWVVFSFTYRDNVKSQDDCDGNPGDDVYVDAVSASNSGTFTLDGWGGDQSFDFFDKANNTGCSFIFDNDTDSKGNPALEADLGIWSGSGWFTPSTSGSRDWLFIGELQTVPVEQQTWGAIKSRWQE